MRVASLVYLLFCTHKSSSNCWNLFHHVSLLSQEPLLSRLQPHIYFPQTNILFLKSEEKLSSPFLFDFPHIIVNHSPNADGKLAWTLPLVAFSQDRFSLNIMIYSSEKKWSLSGFFFPLTRNWLFMKVATLAVRVSSDNALTEGIAKCTVKKKKTLQFMFLSFGIS